MDQQSLIIWIGVLTPALLLVLKIVHTALRWRSGKIDAEQAVAELVMSIGKAKTLTYPSTGAITDDLKRKKKYLRKPVIDVWERARNKHDPKRGK